MKQRMLSVCLLVSACVICAAAAGGTASDPLVSLSYLNTTFTTTVNQRVDTKLERSDQAIRDTTGGVTPTDGGWTERRFKEADTLSCQTGANVLLLAGSMQVSFSSGAVIDITTGTEIASGSAITPRHRYMTAEDTQAVFTVTSKTAVVHFMGGCSTSLSSAVDYNAIAAALKQLNLFKGSFTGYGEGYDLEVAPTRLQALIMFIRVLGEESDALSWTGSTPFSDVARGSDTERYVGYAYTKGYTNGYTATTFQPGRQITVNQYMEFMLRALGYSAAGSGNLSGTMTLALNSGVIRPSELSMLQQPPFLRAQLVYISYCALDSSPAGTELTLRQSLLNRGVFTSGDVSAAEQLAPSPRLS